MPKNCYEQWTEKNAEILQFRADHERCSRCLDKIPNGCLAEPKMVQTCNSGEPCTLVPACQWSEYSVV